MRKSILPLILFLAGILFFGSCKKETVNVSQLKKGHSFYPLKIGKYVLYDVDSTIWDDYLKAQIPSQCQLRYDVVDTFRNDSDELAYVIDVRYRKTELDQFVPYDVIYAVEHNNQLIVTQHNLKFIKLTFPIANGVHWNGNALIPLGNAANAEYADSKWDYTYDKFDESFNTGIKVFQHTVTVNEIDDSLNNPDLDSTAYAYRNYSKEIYANNVGLIYRERIYWTFQPAAPGGQGGGSGYRKGYSVIMRAVEHN